MLVVGWSSNFLSLDDVMWDCGERKVQQMNKGSGCKKDCGFARRHLGISKLHLEKMIWVENWVASKYKFIGVDGKMIS
jgi:hypothetical protein